MVVLGSRFTSVVCGTTILCAVLLTLVWEVMRPQIARTFQPRIRAILRLSGPAVLILFAITLILGQWDVAAATPSQRVIRNILFILSTALWVADRIISRRRFGAQRVP